MARQARQGHHNFLQHVFSDALDDRDLADLARVMSRISACTVTPGADA
jgi:hypothetical protein